MKTTVIYHNADFDGLFCREIARKFLPDAELIGWDHSYPKIPLPKEGLIYILDLPMDCLTAGGDALIPMDRFVWIDHHKSAIDKFSKDIPGCRIDGVAACRLAWQWFILGTSDNPGPSNGVALPTKEDFIDRIVIEPLAVRLAGEYDIWDKRDPDAETFQFGLRSETLEWPQWRELLCQDTKCACDDFARILIKNGKVLQRYQREQDASLIKRGFDVEFEGKKFLALNIARCNSLTFESAARPDHDGLMGFYWDGKTWRVSLYHTPHRKDIDLSEIAVKHGGGGHRGACGFAIEKLPFIP